MKFHSRRSKASLAVVGLAMIFLLGMGAERIITRAERSASSDSIFPQANAQGYAAGDIPTIVEKVVPAVVNISSKRVTQVSQRTNPLMQDPFFRRFFGDAPDIPRERVERSLGSGVIVSEDGYILTNNHLVQNATEVEVVLPPPDNRTLDAKVVGTDERTDVAVLKVDGKNLPTIPLGTSEDLRLGETVLAIGYPFQVGQTVTMGIVSGLSKAIAERQADVEFIQTDAAINPGNSGGALINTRGELVGINSLIYSNTGSYAGLSFAVPIDVARSVMDDIRQHGKVVRGYLGINMDNLTPEKAEFFGVKKSEGVIVTEVEKGSPAMKAGVKVDDVVVAVNGKDVKNMGELRRLIGTVHPGEKASLDLFREGKSMRITVTTGRRPDEEEAAAEKPAEEKGVPELALLTGVALEDLNDYYRQELELPEAVKGVLVTKVDDGSPASDQGLRRGDVIVKVNRKAIRNLAEFRTQVKGMKGDKLMFTIYRGGGLANIVLTP